MVIDHACKIFFPFIDQLFTMLHLPLQASFFIYYGIESFGRIAFVLFAFMVAEGCRYTRDIKKYFMRLCFFGVISEIPFQWMTNIILDQKIAFKLAFTNVYFTLALGVLAIYGYQYFKERKVLKWVLPLSCAIIAVLIHCDYSAIGVMLIFACYYFQNEKDKIRAIVIIQFVQYLLIFPLLYGGYQSDLILFGIYFLYSMLAVVLIKHYNHERGKSLKYVFYVFYPIHLLILCSIYTLLI